MKRRTLLRGAAGAVALSGMSAPSGAAPDGDSQPISATFEDDPAAAVADVVHDGEEFLFFWGAGRKGEIVVRRGTPWDLSDGSTVLDGFDSQPKFSAVHADGATHLLVGEHGRDSVAYYRSTAGAAFKRQGTAFETSDVPARFQARGFYRVALSEHDGEWHAWVTVRHTGQSRKQALHLRGENPTDLAYEGVAFGTDRHPELNGSANVGAVWYDTDAGQWRAYVDGTRWSKGTHAVVYRAWSDDAQQWTLADDPDVTRDSVPDGSYNDLHIYAPAGAWVDGTFVGLMPGSDTVTGRDGDNYDHDTALVVADSWQLSLDNLDPEEGASPAVTPTPRPGRTGVQTGENGVYRRLADWLGVER